MEASGNNRSCLLSSPTTLSQKGRGRKEEAVFYQKVICNRYKSHLLASVKSEALQVTGRQSSSVPGSCAGLGSPCLMMIGSSVHQHQAFTNSKSNHYLHLYCHPNSDTYPIGLDLESSKSMFSNECGTEWDMLSQACNPIRTQGQTQAGSNLGYNASLSQTQKQRTQNSNLSFHKVLI